MVPRRHREEDDSFIVKKDGALPPSRHQLCGGTDAAFGVLIALFPHSGALAMIYAIGVYAILAGTARMVVGFRVRNLEQHLATHQAT